VLVGLLVVVASCSVAIGTHALGSLGSGASGTRTAVRLDPPARGVTVVAGGDVLTEERVRYHAARYGALSGRRFDFDPMFAPVAPILRSADVAICNMEIPVGIPGGPYGYAGRSPYGGNLLLAPYEIAPGLRNAGFDRCSTATNHAFDLGVAGIGTTIEALGANGIGSTGTARRRAESAPPIFVVDGVRIAHVSYTIASNTVPPADAWRLNLSQRSMTIAADVQDARRRGAQIVLLSVHVSIELQPGPTWADRALVDEVVRSSDVDAVFVHGPHVVQPVEMVRGTPVWWSLGNFVSEMGPPSTGRYADPRTSDGLLASVRFGETVDGDFAAYPATIAICNDLADRTVRSATAGLTDPNLPPRVHDELRACLARTRSVVPTAR
jgi:hypothetical protein